MILSPAGSVTIHRGGKDGITHPEFDTHFGRSQIVDNDHDKFVESFQEDVINQRRHQVKGMMKRKVIGTMGTTQTRNQACCSRRKMIRQGRSM